MQLTKFLLVTYLFPLLFMFHEFEEIIWLKSRWNHKLKTYLRENHPRLFLRIYPRIDSFSTAQFTFAVAEEFIIVSLITMHALLSGFYYLWIGLFIAFSIHLIIHLIQWIYIRKYIPCIVTTFLLLPYSLYGFKVIISQEFPTGKIFVWSAAGLILTGINLYIILKVSKKLIQ